MSARRRKRKKKSLSHTKKDVRQSKAREHLPVGRRDVSEIFKAEEKQKTIEKVSRNAISGWRLWLFRIVALTVIPAVVFLLLELGLRIVGYGYPTSAIIKCQVNGADAYCDNVKFGWRFFPRNIAKEMEPFILTAKKPDDVYRIFVFGGSAARGTPDTAYGFWRILGAMLRQRYPGVNFEVINTAMTAVNSHVVLEVAKDCARHEANLFVVYLGNNEVIGPYGAGTVFSPLSSSLSVIRFGIALKGTKLGQLLTALFESISAKKNVPQIWRGMEMFLEKQVRADDPGLQTVYKHYRSNLQDIRRIARKNGTKIIFSTVCNNLKDNPPFGSLHRPDLTEAEMQKWEDICQQGVRHETAGEYAEAVERYLTAGKIDGSYADLQFRLGRCYWVMEEYSKAKERYVQAKQMDTFRFCDAQINEIIRKVAGNRTTEGVYLADAVKAFENNSPHMAIGKELFYEHAHMNFKGNYILAETILEQVEKLLPDRIKRQKANKQRLLTEAECAQSLAYTVWDRYKIADRVLNGFIRRPPFTNQLYHNEHVKRLERELSGLKANLIPAILVEAAAQYESAIENASNDWRLRLKYGQLLLDGLMDYPAATEQYRFVINSLPHSYWGYIQLAIVSQRTGALDAAESYFTNALRRMPIHVRNAMDVDYNLGLVYHLQGRRGQAIENYSKALRFRPEHAGAYNNMGLALYEQGKLTEAEKIYRRGLTRAPGNLDLHHNLGILLGNSGRKNEAIKELRRALQIDPNSVKTRTALRMISKKNVTE